MNYYPPKYYDKKYHCPYCGVFSQQSFHDTYYSNSGRTVFYDDLKISICTHCNQKALWLNEVLLVPDNTIAPMPHPDLPEEIQEDYNEARSISNRSPRGSAALLRLCLQKLMKELGESGKNIDNDISSLIKKGLPAEVAQALDVIRVIGNEAVHPGELDIKDDHATVLQLFELINFIVEDRITRKKKIAGLFDMLPQSKRDGITNRDTVK